MKCPNETVKYIHTKGPCTQIVKYLENTKTPLINTLDCLQPEGFRHEQSNEQLFKNIITGWRAPSCFEAMYLSQPWTRGWKWSLEGMKKCLMSRYAKPRLDMMRELRRQKNGWHSKKKKVTGKYNNTVIFVEAREDSSVTKMYWTNNTRAQKQVSFHGLFHHLRKSTFPIIIFW